MPWILAKGDTIDTRAYIPKMFATKEEALDASFSHYKGFYPEAGTHTEIASEWAAYAAYQLRKMKGRRKR